MDNISIIVYGEPVAQGRPRFSTANGFVRAYDPAKSRDYKDYIKLAAGEQMSGKKLMDGALYLGIKIFRPMPKSMSKKKAIAAENGDIRPTTKPDLDNYIKCVKDALKGIVWKDDSQVIGYLEPTGKYYSSRPRIEIEVKEA